MGIASWKDDLERGAGGARGGDADAALVVLDDLLDDGEAEAGALGFAGEEGLEDVLCLVRGDGEACLLYTSPSPRD